MALRSVHLPSETIDLILANINDDEVRKRHLSACSLVSRHWHFPAKAALFHTIEFSSQSDTLPRDSQDPNITLAEDFDEILHDSIPPPNTALLIKHLKVQLLFPVTVDQISSILALHPAIQYLTLRLEVKHCVAPSVPLKRINLKVLNLRSVLFSVPALTPWSKDDIDPYAVWLPNPTDDVGASADKPSNCTLLQLLNLFGEVTTLVLENALTRDRVMWVSVPSLSKTRTFPRPTYRSALWAEAQKLPKGLSVQSLVLPPTFSVLHNWVGFLLLTYTRYALEHLQHLEILGEHFFSRDALTIVGPSLTYLKTTVLGDSSAEDKLPDPRLFERANNLSHFHLSTYIIPDNLTGDPTIVRRMFDNAVRPISVLPQTITHLTLQVQTCKSFVKTFEWENLDRVAAKYNRLVNVQIMVTVGSITDWNPEIDFLFFNARKKRPKVTDGPSTPLLPLNLETMRKVIIQRLPELRNKVGDGLTVQISKA
ncbi:hypothetical protein BXZ70DRAFT_1003199 [Cristinia sonorae]|uniref:F-box domain-containing protein n=1 Tax=Cristinia sonorae TaxID=1940300 RepID=A0A8K0V170_9AGAR|nr:hypothetical protein BXZ70DRAFT_1003199 [Cristinia sonorae]